MNKLALATGRVAALFSEYQGTNANQVVNGVKKLFGTVGTWGGALYLIFAIFTLVLAIRNEDNEGRNKAALNILAALALLSFSTILNMFFS